MYFTNKLRLLLTFIRNATNIIVLFILQVVNDILENVCKCIVVTILFNLISTEQYNYVAPALQKKI